MTKRYLFIFLLFWPMLTIAAGDRYKIRVDGLSCPFCAYGIEKKLVNTSGVRHVDIDFEKGLVIVDVESGLSISEDKMDQLFEETGFSFRSMTIVPQ